VAYAWYDRNHGIPIFDDLGAGQPYILFDSPGDAKRFMYEYVDRYGLEDVSHIDLFELEVKRKADAEYLIDISPRESGEENLDGSEQSDISDY
jgi:hypothetical protein